MTPVMSVSYCACIVGTLPAWLPVLGCCTVLLCCWGGVLASACVLKAAGSWHCAQLGILPVLLLCGGVLLACHLDRAALQLRVLVALISYVPMCYYRWDLCCRQDVLPIETVGASAPSG